MSIIARKVRYREPHSAETKARAFELRQNGFTIAAISRELVLSRRTLNNWFSSSSPGKTVTAERSEAVPSLKPDLLKPCPVPNCRIQLIGHGGPMADAEVDSWFMAHFDGCHK